MSRQLWFETNLFVPIPGEEEETNHGRFGKALAIWLQAKIEEKRNVALHRPIAEDWGWVILLHEKPYRLWVGCGNEDGSERRWCIFAEAEISLVSKLRGAGREHEAVACLESDLEQIIRGEPAIENVAWESE